MECKLAQNVTSTAGSLIITATVEDIITIITITTMGLTTAVAGTLAGTLAEDIVVVEMTVVEAEAEEMEEVEAEEAEEMEEEGAADCPG